MYEALIDGRIVRECAAMPCLVELLRSRSWPRAATLALITIGLAACSGVSSRFNESSPEATEVAPVKERDLGSRQSIPSSARAFPI